MTVNKTSTPWGLVLMSCPLAALFLQSGFAANPSGIKITPLDDYEQWQDARNQTESTAASAFKLPPGFQIDLVRSAREGEDSWINLRFDPQGRVLVAKEKIGLLRLTLSEDHKSAAKVETINDMLPEVRGLVFAGKDLFANSNNHNQKQRSTEAGLYRLRDTNGDDRFDEVKLIGPPTRTGGHGRNDITLGLDGMIYLMHGDSVSVPSDALHLPTPVSNVNPGDDRHHGHLIRTDTEGMRWEIVSQGLRNPFGIAFNEDGEAFTYDADAEHDMGSPWYRPTRVRHLVSGGDYGWRSVTGTWPPYYPDHADEPPNTFDIGKGSPTAVEFGTRSHFPPAYRKALFILDWTYGRIIAAHLTPTGASYQIAAETFLRGRPANVTDLDFGPDGALYFVTGGRGTQSGLYRVSYTGSKVTEPVISAHERTAIEAAAKARALRRKLETFHRGADPKAVETVWPHLDHADPWIRHAARVALEHQPAAGWQEKALAEKLPVRALNSLMALTRVGRTSALSSVLERALALSGSLTAESDKLDALRTVSLCLQRIEQPEPRLAIATVQTLDRQFPDTSTAVNRELATLLCGLGAPGVVPRTLALVDKAASQEDRMHYLFVLRNTRTGWTPELRLRYFVELARMDAYRGGAGLPKFIAQIRTEALAGVPVEERKAMQAVLDSGSKSLAGEPVTARSFVKHWTVADLDGPTTDKPDRERGRQMFQAAMCSRCHTLGSEGRAFGPDLTNVSSRFNRHDLLQSIVEPSKVVAENFRNVIVSTKDGEIHTGQVVLEGDYRSTSLKLVTDPMQPFKMTNIPKANIVSHRESEVSPMPEGLLDSLTKEEILDLLAYLESGGRVAAK